MSSNVIQNKISSIRSNTAKEKKFNAFDVFLPKWSNIPEIQEDD